MNKITENWRFTWNLIAVEFTKQRHTLIFFCSWNDINLLRTRDTFWSSQFCYCKDINFKLFIWFYAKITCKQFEYLDELCASVILNKSNSNNTMTNKPRYTKCCETVVFARDLFANVFVNDFYSFANRLKSNFKSNLTDYRRKSA